MLIYINTAESQILFQARALRVQIYCNQKEIEYVNLTFQIILEPVLKPALPSFTFYRPSPPPGVARFCDTHISSLNIDFGWSAITHDLKIVWSTSIVSNGNCFWITNWIELYSIVSIHVYFIPRFCKKPSVLYKNTAQ